MLILGGVTVKKYLLMYGILALFGVCNLRRV